jgi:hypothetical protein
MRSVDDFISDFLAHRIADPETPAERRERYLRERELKGRKVGSSTPAPAVRRPSAPALTKGVPKPAPKKPSVDPAKKRAETEARIEAMQQRLDTLRELLRQLVEKAKERSGVEDPKDEKPAKTTKPSDRKPLSEAEKAKAAKEAEEWRKNNPDKVLDQQVERLSTQIKNVEAKIAEMRKKLAESPAPPPLRKSGPDKVGYNPQPRR